MDVRTLKRRLVRYKLSRNESWRNEVRNLIKEEMLYGLVAWRVTGKCGIYLK